MTGLKKRRDKQAKIRSLIPMIEPMVEGRSNALELSAHEIKLLLEQQHGIKVHEEYVNKALDEMGYAKIEGTRKRVKA